MSYSLYVCALIYALAFSGCRGYDPDTPDTAANRQGFENRLGMKPGPDVKELYFYAEEGGSGTRFQLRFECSRLTIDTIVAGLALTHTTPPASRHTGRTDFAWWREKDLPGMAVHWKASAKGDYHWFLWYDEGTGEAFFLEYSG